MSGQPIITLAGDLGSGKSTVCSLLEDRLGWNKYSTGVVMRDMAAKRSMTVLEMNKLADIDPSIDREIDAVFKSLARSPKPLLVDSRMAWYFLPKSFKVRLTVNTRIAAARVFHDPNRLSENQDSLEDVFGNLKARQDRENVRYKGTYGVEIRKPSNYDLMIDTSQAAPEDVANLILHLSKDYFSGHAPYAYWVSPKNLLPIESFDKIDVNILDEVQRSIAERGFDIVEPIDVIENDRHYYILNGHKRVSGALKAQLPFVPVIIKESDVPSVSAQIIETWETKHNFKFISKP